MVNRKRMTPQELGEAWANVVGWPLAMLVVVLVWHLALVLPGLLLPFFGA